MPIDPERYKCGVATMGCRTRVFEDRWGEKTSNRPRQHQLLYHQHRDASPSSAWISLTKRSALPNSSAKLDDVLDITATSALTSASSSRRRRWRSSSPCSCRASGYGAEKPEAGPRRSRASSTTGTLGIGFIGLGGMSGCARRQAPRRERRGSGAGPEESCTLHAFDRANELQREVSAQLLCPAPLPPRDLSRQVHFDVTAKQFGIIPGVTDRDLLYQLQPRAGILPVLQPRQQGYKSRLPITT